MNRISLMLAAATLLPRTWTAGPDGCVQLEPLVEGTWRFAVVADGHRARTLGPFEIAAGADGTEPDLGEVRLEPVD